MFLRQIGYLTRKLIYDRMLLQKDGGVNMATTSFTKNFCVSAEKSAEFVTHMTRDTRQVLPIGFNSKYEHPKHHQEALKRIFGK